MIGLWSHCDQFQWLPSSIQCYYDCWETVTNVAQTGNRLFTFKVKVVLLVVKQLLPRRQLDLVCVKHRCCLGLFECLQTSQRLPCNCGNSSNQSNHNEVFVAGHCLPKILLKGNQKPWAVTLVPVVEYVQRIAKLVPNQPNMPKKTSIAYSSFKPAMPPAYVTSLLDNIYLRRQTIIFYLSVKSQHTYTHIHITRILLKLNNIHALTCISNITTSVGVFQRATVWYTTLEN